MKGWKPIDYIVMLFSVAIVMLLMGVLADIVFTNNELSETASKRFNVVVTSMISIISMYVGAQIQKNREQ